MRMNLDNKVNPMSPTSIPEQDDDMPSEINFSGAIRGKFYNPNAQLNIPVYLAPEIQAYLAAIASKKGVMISDIANHLLKHEIEIIEAVI
jgi:hypothetical protein